MPGLTHESVAPAREGRYFSISLSNLRVDTVTDFNLYLRSSSAREPVLYRERGLAFTERVRARLVETGVRRMLVPTEEEDAFHRYLESNLDAILADPEIPLDDKVESLYDCAQFVVHDILSDPASETVVPRSQELVNAAAEFVFADASAFPAFLKATPLDYHVYTHSVNVFVYSMMLARRLKFGDEATLRRLGMGALLHDIGKSKVRPAILNSTRRLDDEEWREMRMHPVWGWEMLREHGVEDTLVLDVTRYHHEKLSGIGYPDRLSANAIPSYVRIVTVCDIFDALTTKRAYKGEISSFPALQLMRTEMKDDLDQEIFESFVRLMALTPSQEQ